MSFTDTEKVKIRRHMGYPASGNSATPHFGHRFMTAYGQLEYKLLHLTSDEETIVRDLVVKADQLEADCYGTRDNLDTAAAAVWTRNADEIMERERLYRSWCMKLCAFFDIPPGKGLSGRSMSVEIVV